MGVFLDDGENGILLPKRYVPAQTKIGDELEVFVYHDSEDRPIATTDHPLGTLGDIVRLNVVSVMNHGAFLDWGLMKDLFIPSSNMISFMRPGGAYLVKILKDEKTGRLVATEKITPFLSNDKLTVKEGDEVNAIIYRRTNIGYEVILNNQHTGILHFNEAFREYAPGDSFTAFVKCISRNEEKNKTLVDVVAGKKGYAKVENETDKILEMLRDNDGYLPFNDKSTPEEIYATFGISKKTFKMALGQLYKQQKISFNKTGISLISN